MLAIYSVYIQPSLIKFCSKILKSLPLFLPSLTSKPIEPSPSTLKADLAVFVNSNILITNIMGKNSLEYVLSSMSASKFEFLELPIGTGSTQFEYEFAHDTNLQIYIPITLAHL